MNREITTTQYDFIYIDHSDSSVITGLWVQGDGAVWVKFGKNEYCYEGDWTAFGIIHTLATAPSLGKAVNDIKRNATSVYKAMVGFIMMEGVAVA
jgi:hypothetical protein